MSLPVRNQPFQSPNDFIESRPEQQAFADMAFATPRTGIVRLFWNRFETDQVSNRLTRARKEQPPPLSQFFNYNRMNIIDGGFSVKNQNHNMYYAKDNSAGEQLARAKLERNTINHARLNVNLDPATRTQSARAQQKAGHLIDKTNHFVSTRISTS